ncbi:hypothetical protein GCM10012275_19830 [Longimycelium tulufanense]|uniref:YcaO domain-containing protein n=1 Tax=Longimycelium tulufanense TaxID=907463 RepID=A0A8J3CD74_9PSEU|nr:hypothetical protein [Longimycelium tulufanense]GGM48973.1 hypothetical protein GCM10012275_19830 [Longimycelium tulufanense]
MAAPPDQLRLMVRPGVQLIRTPEGVVLTGGGGQRVTVRGESAYRAITWLSSQLDGRRTLAELLEDIDQDHHSQVIKLITVLGKHGLLSGLETAGPHSLTRAELSQFASEITLIAACRDSAERRFQQYRHSLLVVIGHAPAVATMVRLAVASGVLRVRAVVLPPVATHHDAFVTQGLEELPPEVASSVQVTHLAEYAGGALHDLIADASMVLHLSEPRGEDLMRALDQLCDQVKIPLIPALVTDRDAWIGPVGTPGRPETRWEAFWTRYRSTRHRKPPHPDEMTHPAATRNAVAAHLMFRGFRYLTGIEDHERPAVQQLHLDTLQLRGRVAVPHPHALPVTPDTAAGIVLHCRALRSRDTIDERQIYERLRPSIDEELGLLRAVHPAEGPQLPIDVAEVVVSDPLGGFRRRSLPLVVQAGGADFPQARTSAVRAACRIYSSLAVDPRRLRPGQSWSWHAGSRPKDWADGRLWALSLLVEQPLSISAGAVFPQLLSHDLGVIPAGVASGHNFAAAVEQGLLDQCALQTLRSDATVAVPLSFGEIDLDEVGRYYCRLLEITGEEVEIFQLAGSLPVPAVVVATPTVGAVPAAARSLQAALREGIERTLLRLQLSDHPRAGVELVEDEFSAYGAGWLRDRIAGRGEKHLTSVTSTGEMLEALRRRRMHPVVVPLDHDPFLARIHPFLVRVVLVDE